MGFRTGENNADSTFAVPKPLYMRALWNLILGVASVATIVASRIGIRHPASGIRLGWWSFTRGLQAYEWAAISAAVRFVLSGLGAGWLRSCMPATR